MSQAPFSYPLHAELRRPLLSSLTRICITVSGTIFEMGSQKRKMGFKGLF